MKSIMTSVSPYLCGKIASGQCKILVRKFVPKEVPFKAYIYCTKTKNKWNLSDYEGAYQNSKGEIVYAQQHVIGEFICNKVMFLTPLGLRGFKMREEILKSICLTNDDLNTYGGLKTLYGWHISNLKIYDKPLLLSELGVNRPPQSYMFVEEI